MGGVAVVWGGGILVHAFTKAPSTNEAYQSGANAATIFGALLVLGGLYYLFKRDGSR
jgi:LPXTG-motif cell wall-anchored protein